MYLYVFGVKHQGACAARRYLWLSQELEEEAIHQITFTELTAPHGSGSALLPPVLPFMDYLLWCWCPVCDWSPTAISGTREWPSGRICKEPAWKQKQNLKASSGGPEIRGPRSLFSLAWQNSPNNQKIRKKIFCFQGLKRDFSFHPAHQHNTIPM